jgi:murein L,D-transpeptidase YcbB/YkuD
MAHFVFKSGKSIKTKQINTFYNKAMEGKEGFASHTVVIDKKLPVHIVYWTAWVDDDSVHYANDIYERDTILKQALAGKAPQKIQGVE